MSGVAGALSTTERTLVPQLDPVLNDGSVGDLWGNVLSPFRDVRTPLDLDSVRDLDRVLGLHRDRT